MIPCRFRTQIEICKLIRCLPNEDSVVSFGTVLIQELGYTSLQQYLYQTFLENRLMLSDESNNKLLSHLINLHDPNIHSNSKCNDTPCPSSLSRLESLPKDIFNHIGLYLNNVDCALGFSHCNHNIHKMVLNKQFIACSKQTEYCLQLTPKIIQKITQHNTCSMLIYHGCNGVSFKNVDKYGKISCRSKNLCELCRFHKKIEKSIKSIDDEKNGNNINNYDNINSINNNSKNELDNKNNSKNKNENKNKNKSRKSMKNKTNYNLLWYPKLLSKIRTLSLDSDWLCLCRKLPFKWLLKPSPPAIRRNTNNNVTTLSHINQDDDEDEDGEAKLSITGLNGANLGDEHSVQFAQYYEEYFINQCNSDISKVRKISLIDFGYAKLSAKAHGITPQYLKMHQNFGVVFVNAFRLQCLQINSFKQFFKIFHCNLKKFELIFYGRRFNRFENMFFKSNSTIYNEITKIDKKQEFFDGIGWIKDQLKLECINNTSTNDNYSDEMMLDVESLLPNINELRITDEINEGDKGIVFAKFNYLLNHPKMLTLLNIHKSVTKLRLSLDGLQTFMDAKFDCIVDTISQVAQQFDKLWLVEVTFNGQIRNEDLFKGIHHQFPDVAQLRKDGERKDAKMIEMLNKYQNFFSDGHFDKVLKILIKNNIKMFQITWQTMDEFYHRWGKFQHRELIKIDVAKYNCNKNVCNSDIGLVSGLYDKEKLQKILGKFHEYCSVSRVNSYAWRWVTLVIFDNSNHVE